MIDELLFQVVFKYEVPEIEVFDLEDRFIEEFVEQKKCYYGGVAWPSRIEGGIYQQSREPFDGERMKLEFRAFFRPIGFVKEVIFK